MNEDRHEPQESPEESTPADQPSQQPSGHPSPEAGQPPEGEPSLEPAEAPPEGTRPEPSPQPAQEPSDTEKPVTGSESAPRSAQREEKPERESTPARRNKAGKKLSPEERKALKERQETMRRAAVKAKSRQFYKLADLVAIAGVIVALAAFLTDFYGAPEETRSGIQTCKDVLFSSRAYVMDVHDSIEPFKFQDSNPAQLLLAIMPFVLLATLLLFLVDIVDALGGILQLVGMLVAVGGSSVVYWVSLGGRWPGVKGGALVPLLLGLFILFVGSMASLPGSMRRLKERQDKEEGGKKEEAPGGSPPAGSGKGTSGDENASSPSEAESNEDIEQGSVPGGG